jgi:hypothetical protein
MRQKLFFLRSDRRVHNVNGDVRILERPAVEKSPTEVDDPDSIGLARRLDPTFPHSDPSGLGHKFKVSKVASDSGILLVNA